MNVRENDKFDLVDGRVIKHFGALIGRMGYLFRKLNFEDGSIDGEIELNQVVGNKEEKIGVKVFSEESLKKTSDGFLLVEVTDKILSDWRGYKHPVILVISGESGDQEIWWERVDGASQGVVKINPNRKLDEKTPGELLKIQLSFYRNFGLELSPAPFSEVIMELGQYGKGGLELLEETYNEACLMMENEDYCGAKTIYEAMTIVFKKVDVFRLNYALSLYHSKKFEECIDLCIDLMRTYKHNPKLLSLISNCYAKTMDLESAQKYLEKAVELRPLSEELWNGIGLLQLVQGKYSAAHNTLKLARGYASSKPSNDLDMALCCGLVGNNNEALGHYEEYMRVNPKSYHAYNNKALLLKNTWKLGEAIVCFEKAIEINPDNFNSVFNLACLLKDMGNHEKAIEYFDRCIEMGKDSEKIYYELACLYCRISEMDRAAYYFNKSYDYVKYDVERKEFYGTVQIIDSEYEALYLVEVEYTPDAVNIKNVKCDKKLTFFNMNSFVKESVKMLNDKK